MGGGSKYSVGLACSVVEQLTDRLWETGSDKKNHRLYKTNPSFGMVGEMNWQNAG